MRAKISLVYIVLCILLPRQLHAQTVLLKQTVPEDFSTVDDNKGPNRRNFSYPFSGIGWHIDGLSHQNDTLLQPVYFQSLEVKFGTREKIKLNGLLALGTDLEISLASHKTNIQDPYIQSIIPANSIKTRYLLSKVGAAGYFQINLKPRRGNQLGHYIDLGGFANFLFGRRLIETYSNANSKEKTKIVQKKLQELNKIDYGILLRYGQNTWAVYTKYRYSNTFKDMPYINLPRITIGFEYFLGNV